MTAAVILIIEDERPMRHLLEITLQSHGYVCREASTAKEGLVMAKSRPPDLILLDLGLPDDSGHNVLSRLREWYSGPVFILSVQNNEQEIVKALDNGANDYLIKPYRGAELLARIRSALRGVAHPKSEIHLDCGDLQIHFDARRITRHGDIVKLTATEYALFALLARNEGKVLTHPFLLQEVWGPTYVNESQYLRVYIAQLRKKTEDNPNKPVHLITEPGVGYRFVSKK